MNHIVLLLQRSRMNGYSLFIDLFNICVSSFISIEKFCIICIDLSDTWQWINHLVASSITCELSLSTLRIAKIEGIKAKEIPGIVGGISLKHESLSCHADRKHNDILMGWCKKDITQVRWQWSYIFLALSHHCWWHDKARSQGICNNGIVLLGYYDFSTSGFNANNHYIASKFV